MLSAQLSAGASAWVPASDARVAAADALVRSGAAAAAAAGDLRALLHALGEAPRWGPDGVVLTAAFQAATAALAPRAGRSGFMSGALRARAAAVARARPTCFSGGSGTFAAPRRAERCSARPRRAGRRVRRAQRAGKRAGHARGALAAAPRRRRARGAAVLLSRQPCAWERPRHESSPPALARAPPPALTHLPPRFLSPPAAYCENATLLLHLAWTLWRAARSPLPPAPSEEEATASASLLRRHAAADAPPPTQRYGRWRPREVAGHAPQTPPAPSPAPPPLLLRWAGAAFAFSAPPPPHAPHAPHAPQQQHTPPPRRTRAPHPLLARPHATAAAWSAPHLRRRDGYAPPCGDDADSDDSDEDADDFSDCGFRRLRPPCPPAPVPAPPLPCGAWAAPRELEAGWAEPLPPFWERAAIAAAVAAADACAGADAGGVEAPDTPPHAESSRGVRRAQFFACE
jgi:hypothetical protein